MRTAVAQRLRAWVGGALVSAMTLAAAACGSADTVTDRISLSDAVARYPAVLSTARDRVAKDFGYDFHSAMTNRAEAGVDPGTCEFFSPRYFTTELPPGYPKWESLRRSLLEVARLQGFDRVGDEHIYGGAVLLNIGDGRGGTLQVMYRGSVEISLQAVTTGTNCTLPPA